VTPDETTTPHTEPQLRALLRVLADPAGLTVALMVVSEHLSDAPTVFDVPISADLAQEFLKEVTEPPPRRRRVSYARWIQGSSRRRNSGYTLASASDRWRIWKSSFLPRRLSSTTGIPSSGAAICSFYE